MRNIKLILQYDGTGFSGWQSQKQGERTVQGVLEEAILTITGVRPSVVGAGRTDAGAHAIAQAAAFRTGSALPADTLKRALNAVLPPDVRVVSASEADDNFHPRHGAIGKVYFYLIANMEYAPPLVERSVWRVPQRLDLGAMREAALHFVGSHDFRAFMGSGSEVKTTVREVRRLDVEEADGMGFLGAAIPGRFIRVSAEGDGFLRHMVRNITGTLVEVGKGRISPGSVPEILASGDRRLSGPTAPAKGLFLERVLYPPPAGP